MGAGPAHLRPSQDSNSGLCFTRLAITTLVEFIEMIEQRGALLEIMAMKCAKVFIPLIILLEESKLRYGQVANMR